MKKVEIHVFSDKTSKSKNFRISLSKFILVFVFLVLGILGFVFFAPDKIFDNITNGNALAVYRQNKAIKNEIKEIRETLDESILHAEETKIIRDSTISKGGLSYTLDDEVNAFNDSINPRKSLNEIERSFKKLLNSLERDSVVAAAVPSIRPLKNSPIIKNRFEMIYDAFTEQELPHRGIDYVAQIGDTVYATGGGTVIEVKKHRGYGLSVKIEHLEHVRTFYAHLGEALVKVGSKVKRGAPIAIIGESGTETSIGLHYEIRIDGVPVNPEDYFITR